jgi:uncharacterized caspase-like protein
MKSFFLALILTIVSPVAALAQDQKADTTSNTGVAKSPSDAAAKPIADKWAVIVGISKYQDASIPPLHYAEKDAKDFADFLVQGGHFAKDHVRLLTNEQATREAILREVGDTFLPRVAHPDDLVVFYFSGHGSPSSRDIGHMNYIVAYDSHKSSLFASAIAVRSLPALMHARVPAGRTVIVLDAAHSGGAIESAEGLDLGSTVNNRGWLEPGQVMLCSSCGKDRNWDSKRYANGVFTHRLIECLRKAGPEANLTDVFNKVRQATTDEVKEDEGVDQQPVMQTFAGGKSDIKLGATPAKAGSVPSSVEASSSETTTK